MADGIFGRLGALFGIAPEPPKPYKQQGVPGYSSWGGWVIAPEENPDLSGPNRWKTASDLLANISIIAASARYSLNLISRPSWKADPPSDKPEAKAMAEFVEEVINGIDTSWARIIRRSAMYRYHGFNLQEWVAKKRDDGKIGIESVEQRPVHTVHRWDLDDNGGLLGVVQVSPQTGKEIYLPRQKLIYLVDDALTDRPDGYGWFRHLAEPASRLKRYLKLETMGFERDLAGIPVGRAPLQRINELVKAGKLEQKQADKMIKSLEDFVQLQAKTPETGLVFDSEPFRAKTESGETISGVQQWGVELLTASPSSVAALGDAIHRLMSDMAMIIGTESLLIGQHSSGSGGSRALSQDKSRNLYLTSNAALSDMAESYDRDIVTTLWNLNGFDEELRPKLKTEDVSFQDAGEIAQALAEMATAGAILAPDDPAINDVREILGISPAPPMDTDTSLMLRGKSPAQQQPPGGGAPGNGTNPPRENPGGGPGGKPPPDPSGGSGRAQKNDPTTLYVNRELENPEPFIAWAKASGFETTLPPGDLHVTVAFSRAPLDWTKVPTAAPTVIAQGGQRAIQPLGDKGAVVLLFESPELSQRWKQLCDLGASWDYDGYRPHVSISYSGTPGLDLSKITPYDGPLEFGPEVFAPVNEDWSTGITEKFNPNHVASGPNGGEFTSATNVSGPGGLSDFMTQLANDPDHHPNIEGLKVDGEAIFHPDKNLRLRREQMPQIPDVHREAFLTTVPNKLEMANPRDLFPSQDQIDGYKTAILATKDIPFQSPIVSADNYIIDGHHHWSSAVVKSVIRGSNQPAMPIHRVNLAHGDLIQRARTYATAHGFKEEPLWKYSPDEPRDDHGRWTTGGPGTIQQLSPAQMAEAMRILRTANWANGPFSGVRGMLNAQTDQIDETLDHAQWERPGDFKPWQGVMKYSDDQPRDYHGRWTSGGGGAGGAAVLFEVSPNPDNKALADRWNKLSSSQKQAITDKLARRYTPMVMDAIGVQGHLEPAMGGFEGEVNPSLYMNVSERPFDTAGAIGDTFGQKAMVVMSDSPGKGLSAHGMVSILAPGADAAKLSELQGQIGSLADGFTYHNGRVQILNFSGKADAAFAADIDQALGGNYIVEHAKVYSAYIEESDYARPEGDSARSAWGQVRGHVRSAFSQSLEQELGKAGT